MQSNRKPKPEGKGKQKDYKPHLHKPKADPFSVVNYEGRKPRKAKGKKSGNAISERRLPKTINQLVIRISDFAFKISNAKLSMLI